MKQDYTEQAREVRHRGDRLVSDISARLVLRGTADARETADQLLESVFAEVAAHLGAEYYFNYDVVNGNPPSLRLVSCGEVDDQTRAQLHTIRFGEYLCGLVAETQKPLVLEDLPLCGLPNADALCAFGATSYAGYPMLAGDRLIGTISFATARRTSFSPAELDLIQTVADLLAAAVERDRLAASLRESEARFRAAVAATSELLWTNDADGRMVGLQVGWGDFTGQSPEDYAGHGWSSAVHADDAQRTLSAWEHAVRERRMFVWEHRVRRHDGVYRLFAIRAVPVFNTDGSVREWVGVHRDITDQRAAEESLKDADRRKDEFLATLAHELRNPLAPIRTGLQIMKLSPDSTQALAARDVMERQIGHMVRLIDDLLDVSRISNGKIELRTEHLDLRDIITTAVEASRPFVDAARHELFIELPSQPVWLNADLTRLAQAVSNLINNAAKYTPDEGRISLSVRREVSDAVVEIVDTGVGIPDEMMPRVFDMFAQGNRTLDRAQGGLGVGLTLVRRLVEMHGGTVTAHSDGPACGSTFTIKLPLAEQPHAAEPPGLNAPDHLTQFKRVLVVDDNVDGATSLAALLSLIGHHTHTVYDGPAALMAVREYKPDVVLLDIGLPGMSGYEVAQLVRADAMFDAVTLVALTGWGSDDDKQRSRDAGFDFHLTKPVEAADVLRVLAP